MEIVEKNQKILKNFIGYHHASDNLIDKDSEYQCSLKKLNDYLDTSFKEMSERVTGEKSNLSTANKLTPRQQWELDKQNYLEEHQYWKALKQQLIKQGREYKCESPPNAPFPPEALIVKEGWSVYGEFNKLLQLTSGMTQEEWEHKDDDWLESVSLVVSRSNDNLD